MINTSPTLALTLVPLLVVTSIIIIFFVIKMEHCSAPCNRSWTG